MKFGYNGKILRINLNTSAIDVEEENDRFYRKYMGGACLGAYYLLKELIPGVDPYSEENLIIFSTSPIAGINCSGTAMHAVVSKSPLTNLIGECVTPGGFFAFEMKKAGFDAVIIKGKAKNPSYISIYDNKIEIRNARKIWGKTTTESYSYLINETKDKKTSISLIGPAGENLVRYASILTDNIFLSSRGGLGAVMGSKNLKAICVKGSNNLYFFDDKKINELSNDYKNNFKKNLLCNSQFSNSGNAGYLESMVSRGMFSTQNFLGSFFVHANKIDGHALVKKYQVKNFNCFSCLNGCKKKLISTVPINKENRFGLIELESLASCANNLLIDDPDEAMQIWELICNFGLDGTSLGNVLSFTIELFEKRLLSKESTGFDIRWGNADAVKKLIKMIAFREGIGNLLAEGVKRASSQITGSEKYAMHVKGMELPCHEPRIKQMLGFAYAVSPTGPSYTIVEHDTDFDHQADQLYMDKISPLNLYERLDSETLSEKKIRMFYLLQPAAFSMFDALCCCIFAFSPVRYFNFHQLVEIVNAATGWESSLFELWKLGEKRINMHKIFAVREGIKKEEDMLPERIFQPIKYGPKKGIEIKYEDFIKSRDLYYQLSGWSEDGVPLKPKLLELDLLEFL